MEGHKRVLYFLLVALLALPIAVQAVTPHEKKRVIWSSKPSSKVGLYTVKNVFVSQGITLNASAMYYFGDVDNMGVAFNGGFNVNNLSYGGSLMFAYLMPAGNHCNIRYSLMGGTLHGDNESKFRNLKKPRDDYRKFHSIFIQPAVGVEYYPFSQAGFYLYGGIGVTASIIDNYEFYYMKNVGNHKERTLLKGNTFGILPMVQLGLGYSWRLTESWTMSAELLVQEGLIDTHYMNLDAWPLAASQNSDGVELGASFGTWEETLDDGSKVKHIHWNDGWFQLGITVTYRWNNCEKCRIINNYYGIKPQRSSNNRRRR